MDIYLIRHGESEANVAEVFSGRTDVPLTEKGKEQAKAVALKLKDEKVTRMVASPLQRAFHTAQAINLYHNLEIVKEPLFMEMSFGEWEGKNYREILEEEDRKSAFVKNPEKSYTMAPQGGESIQMTYDRVTPVYDQLVKSLGESDVLVIAAHGAVIQTLLSHIFHGDCRGYWNYRVANCSLIKIQYVMGMPVLNALNG